MSRHPLIFLELILVTCLVSCSSTTIIKSSDEQAKIFVNDQLKGTGTAIYSDSKIVGSINTVRIEKPGCEPSYFTFSRSEELDYGATITGIVLLVPFLWIQKYQPVHDYNYTCILNKAK